MTTRLEGKTAVITGSINETEDLDRLFEVVKNERGGMDILLASAGTSEPTPLAAFLASSDSGFMAGSEVFADGGIAQV